MAKTEKEKEFKVGQKSNIDLTGVDYTKKVKLRALEGAKYHASGETFFGSEVLARKMEADGTAERVK